MPKSAARSTIFLATAKRTLKRERIVGQPQPETASAFDSQFQLVKERSAVRLKTDHLLLIRNAFAVLGADFRTWQQIGYVDDFCAALACHSGIQPPRCIAGIENENLSGGRAPLARERRSLKRYGWNARNP